MNSSSFEAEVLVAKKREGFNCRAVGRKRVPGREFAKGGPEELSSA
jgi:hypothetical protein